LAFQLAPDVVVGVVVVDVGAVVVVVVDVGVVVVVVEVVFLLALAPFDEVVVVDFGMVVLVVVVDEVATGFALLPGISVATAMPTDVVASAAKRTTEAVTRRMRRATYARLAFVSRSLRRCVYTFFSNLVSHEEQLTSKV
jgi:hypothetical protein